MKKITIIFLALIIVFNCFSKPIDSKTSIKVALNYINYRYPEKKFKVKDVIIESDNNEAVYYLVTFQEGGWVMVTADDCVIPILGYSDEGNINKDTQKPDAFLKWTESYKKQIVASKLLKSPSKEAIDQWNTAINNEFVRLKSYSYSYGSLLLSTPRGYVNWGQDQNNDGNCTPSYNKFAPDKDNNNILCTGSSSKRNCEHKFLGCAAVAMAQILWYWQFPQSSNFRAYDWSIMPPAIFNSTPQFQADAIAQLLRDCGDAANTTYCCSGSFATINDVVNGLRNNFKYTSVQDIERSLWYDSQWFSMLRSEIDAGRPILYRGGQIIADWGDVHYFVIDGYHRNPDEFHINWGWAGSSLNGFFSLNDLTPGTHDFNGGQQAIIGISPTCNQVSQNILDLTYQSVNSGEIRNEQARNNINVPLTGKSLSVHNGGKLILTAGNEINLLSNFSSELGSEFKTNFRTLGFGDSGIQITAVNSTLNNTNGYLSISALNADSWTCKVIDITYGGRTRFQSAGEFDSNNAILFYREYLTGGPTYQCEIKLRNSCGEVYAYTYNFNFNPFGN